MGSAGKSTIIKQLQKLCHLRPTDYQMYDEEWQPIHHTFKEHELHRWARIIRKNIIDALQILVKQANAWSLSIKNEKAREFAEKIFTIDSVPSQGDEMGQLGEQLVNLFNDSTIQDTYDKRAKMTGELQLTDGTLYFLSDLKIKEIFSSSYSPSDDDILHARDPTTGITDYRFSINEMKIMIHDIGGQKVERAKTVNYINNWVSADRQNYRNFILYIVSMAEYNLQHPIHDGLTLFDESLKMLELIMELQPVQNCGVMIFLNKEDIFKDKIKRCKDLPEVRGETIKYLGKYMEKGDKDKLETTGDYSYRSMRKCVAAKVAHVVSSSKLKRNKGVYHKYTCAVDSKLMDTLFGAIRNEITNTIIDQASWIF
ncbi:unnamed protein product, partial [Mesorhabditis belari]|uniref:Uncharacterized protein n=1 Tax=Mesorhabditis belari TaxID=2138241 RepID=A0AAF3J226_9BILA